MLGTTAGGSRWKLGQIRSRENALSVNALSYPGQEALFSLPQEDSDNSDMECDSDEPDANLGGKKLGRDDWFSVWEKHRRNLFLGEEGQRVYCYARATTVEVIREHSRDTELIAEYVTHVLQETFPSWTQAQDPLETKRFLENLANALMDPSKRGRYPITLGNTQPMTQG